MKTLKSDINKILGQEFERLSTQSQTVAWDALEMATFDRIKKEQIDLNEYLPEIIAAQRLAFLEGKKRDFPPIEQMLLPTFELSELQDGIIPVGNRQSVKMIDANYEQMMYRWGNQSEAAEAAAATAGNTKRILFSPVGTMMEKDRSLRIGEALRMLRNS